MKQLLNCFFIVIFLTLSGCKTEGGIIPAQLTKLTKPAEPAIKSMPTEYKTPILAIGAEQSLNDYRVMGNGLVPNSVLTQYLNMLLNRIKLETGIPNLPGKVYLTSSEGLDAYTTPDANIFLGFGFLKNLSTEDEVVAILAHELAHIIYGHFDVDMASTTQKQLQQVTQIASQIQANLKNNGVANSVLGKSATQNIIKMQALIDLTDIALLPAWNREQEEEADKLAIDLAIKMGYSNTRGMKSMLELLSSEEEKLEKKTADKNISIQTQFQNELKNGNVNFDAMANNAWDNLRSTLSDKHYSAAKRIVSTNDYYEKFYADKGFKTSVHEADWQKVLKNKSVVQTVANYNLANEANTLFANREIAKALKISRKAASGQTADHPYTLVVLAKLQQASGDTRAFNNTYALSFKSAEPSWTLVELKANFERLAGKIPQSRETMEKGFAYFKEPPNLQPVMIEFYNQIGDKNAANKMQNNCIFSSPEKRDLCFAANKK